LKASEKLPGLAKKPVFTVEDYSPSEVTDRI